MRKSLILFRHAKSDWDASYVSDHERPLAQRGVEAAATMGKQLADSGKVPELILCSTALRTRQTLELASSAGNWTTTIEYTDLLYETSAGNVINLIQQTTDSVSSLMLVGHEPTWSQTTHNLIGGGNIRFPTAAMARIDFYTESWQSIDEGSGQLRWLLQPRFFT